ncbi:MAG: hypothetical protein IJE51_06605 [Clostridia bacterium]|nr:hypothetical protein [Clostridia bacterium]
MKKCLFFVIFCVAMFAVGCSDPHKNLEDFPEIIPDEPEIVMPEDPIQDASSNSDEPSVELEVEEFEFDVSMLTITKYPDAVEDSSYLSLNPTVVRKGNLIDVEISYGNENANGYCGRAYIIEVFIDGNWYDIVGDYKSFVPEQYGDSTFAFTEDPVPLWQINKQTIPVTTSFQNLPIGRYRVVKELNGWKYAEFEIVDSKDFNFDVSKLTPTKYLDAVEDSELLSVEPKVLSKNNLIDITISFGNESLKKVDVVDGKEVNSSPLGDYKWELEVLIDDVWYNVMGDLEKFIPDEYSENLGLLFAIPTIEVYLDNINTWTVPTGTVLSGLPVGRYRIVKDVDGWKYAEFEIVDSKDLNFDVSKLISTQYPEVTEDLTLFSVEPTIFSKNNMVDLTMTFGKEGYGTVDDSMFYVGPYCGYDYTLEVYIDGTWYSIFGDVEKFVPAEYLSKWEESFTFPAGIIPLNQVRTQAVPTGTVLSGLPVGRYRIVKDVDGWKYAEFVIE